MTGGWKGAERGVSLVELLLVIAMIGILAGIAIPIISNITPTAKSGVAEDTVALLNHAVQWYEQVDQKIGQAVSPGSSDEVAIVTMLKNPALPLPGAPFLPDSFPDAASSDNTRYRAVWTGQHFEVVAPGETGTGVLIDTGD